MAPMSEKNAPLVVRSTGKIEELHQGKLVGWASYWQPGMQLEIGLYDRDELVAVTTPGLARPDVEQAGYGDGMSGFEMVIPARLFDDRRHAFSIRNLADGSVIASLDEEIVLKAADRPVRQHRLEGGFDGLQGVHAVGWARYADLPGKPVMVQILAGGRAVALGKAHLYRADLDENGTGEANCMFSVPLPQDCLAGGPRDLVARDVDTGAEIGRLAVPIRSRRPLLQLIGLAVSEGTIDVRLRTYGDPSGIELLLFIDDAVIARLPAEAAGSGQIRLRVPLPEFVMDGIQHPASIHVADTGEVIGTGLVTMPNRLGTRALLERMRAAERVGLPPPPVAALVDRMVGSALFDADLFARSIRRDFTTPADAALFYLMNSWCWAEAPSPWLDLDFIHGQSGGMTLSQISPIEWYLDQPSNADVGPNPLFSNADYCIFRDQPMAEPEGASLFDDWLVSARKGATTQPSALVDLMYLGSRGKGPIIERLEGWLATAPSARTLDDLHPCFERDWLDQQCIERQKTIDGCRLTALRLGHLTGMSPLALLQHSGADFDYYRAIREYEIQYRLTGQDMIGTLSPMIDAAAFLEQFPPGHRKSGLYRYQVGDPGRQRRSFLTDVEDAFILDQYPGLLDFCTQQRGVGDINRIWSRWLRGLRIPGTTQAAIRQEADQLALRDLQAVRAHRVDSGDGVLASLIIPSYARDDLVLRCLASAVASPEARRLDFLIAEDAAHVDCGWVLGYFAPFARWHKNAGNLGFLRNCNQAVARCSTEFFVLVNNDVILHQGAAARLLDCLTRHREAAVVGGLILNTDGTVQENGGIIWRDATAANYHSGVSFDEEYLRNVREADYVSGCWIGFRRAVWEEIGGFDERYSPAYCEETDYCLSCWSRGYKVLVNPHSVVTHLGGATMGRDAEGFSLKAYQKINLAKLKLKWAPKLEALHHDAPTTSFCHTGRRKSEKSVTLVMDHIIPETDRDAGSRSTFAVCEALAAVPDNYVVFVPQNGHRSAYARALEELGIEVVTGHTGWKAMTARLEQQGAQIDYCLVSRLGVAQHFAMHLDRLSCPKSIFIHDIEALRRFVHQPGSAGHQALANAAMHEYVHTHAAMFDRFDHLISLSADETRMLKRWLSIPIIDIFPYDLTPVTLAPGHAAQRRDMLFIGSFNHPPNREGIQHFLTAIWPFVTRSLPDARLHLCGSGFEDSGIAAANVVLHGRVSDSTLRYLYSITRVAIAPLLSGAGLKGKVVEAMTHGVPSVGSEAAWQGMQLPPGYAMLSGPMNSFGERLIQTYRASSEQTGHDMIALYRTLADENPIRTVIPSLLRQVLSQRRPVGRHRVA